jgi:hypothetical protein
MEDTYTMLIENKKELIIEPFGYTLFIVFTTSIEGSIQKIKDIYPEDYEWGDMQGVVALHSKHPEDSLATVFFGYDPNIDEVVHEALHVVQRMCSWYHVKDYETEAYLLGYIVNEILKFHKKCPKPNKKRLKIPKKVIKSIKKRKKELDKRGKIIV